MLGFSKSEIWCLRRRERTLSRHANPMNHAGGTIPLFAHLLTRTGHSAMASVVSGSWRVAPWCKCRIVWLRRRLLVSFVCLIACRLLVFLLLSFPLVICVCTCTYTETTIHRLRYRAHTGTQTHAPARLHTHTHAQRHAHNYDY